MKKLIFSLVVLLMATPAFATVTLSSAVDGCDVTISYSEDEATIVRAFGLTISLQDIVAGANIVSVECLSDDFYVFPGSIDIVDGVVQDWGSCSVGSLPGKEIALEMGSLYVGEANAPGSSGDLVRVRIEATGDCNICIEEDSLRGGVVMEDPEEDPTVVAGCTLVPGGGPPPNCWMGTECAGQPSGDATCDGNVNLDDLTALKAAWGMSAPYSPPYCCADFTQDGSVNLDDLTALKGGWGTTGHSPATLNQDCP